MSGSEIVLGVCQLNSSIGDIANNAEKIITHIREAQNANVDLLVFPELALSGYSPQDYLNYSRFRMEIERAMQRIIDEIGDTIVILGAPRYEWDDGAYDIYNSAFVIQHKQVQYIIDKILIPNYDIFNEVRYFKSSRMQPQVIEILGKKFGIEICEDMWDHLNFHPDRLKVTKMLCDTGAEIILNISASPFTLTKAKTRRSVAKNHCIKNGVSLIYVNEVGAQDEIVFDGRSFIINSKGELIKSFPAWLEGLYVCKLHEMLELNKPTSEPYELESWEEEAINAISINLISYFSEISFDGKVIIGLSGGIDSALTAVLAVHALGADRVVGVAMPSKYSSSHSIDDAKALAINLGIEFLVIPIEQVHHAFDDLFLGSELKGEFSIADENLQARIRGNILMYLANKFGNIVISTGNKSEIAVGYCTLYGDTVGGKNLIGDLYKTQIYALADYFNKKAGDEGTLPPIPISSIEKVPSAELRPDQKDSDTLPEYDILDRILSLLIDQQQSQNEIVKSGFNQKLVAKVAQLVSNSEFKRDQLVQSVRLSKNTFGKGRQLPIATKFLP